MKRLLSALLLTFSLTAPLVIAQERDRNQEQAQAARRYYDRTHKDYHQWNDNEERNYSTFRTERNIQNRDFARAKRAEQQQYWNWRHQHPDERR